MQTTPISLRKHVAIFGNTNTGKSTLFNNILGQNLAITSDTAGTTTDPVIKAMELIPFGPVALIDTAGLNDFSDLGRERMAKTIDIINRTDLAIYIMNASAPDTESYNLFLNQIKKRKVPHFLVFTKCDTIDGKILKDLKKEYRNAEFISNTAGPAEIIKQRLNKELSALSEENDTIIGKLLPSGSTVALVVPVDSEAPKGRLILPQVHLIRDCLDNGIKCIISRETELQQVLSETQSIDLVVTDSQIFKFVNDTVPKDILLTSFSMLLANKTGDIMLFSDGAKAIKSIPDGGKILMAEACTHNTSHEDIGRVKIPNLIKKQTGKNFIFTYTTGNNFPSDLSEYHLVIHCGGCMINAKSMQSRIEMCKESNIPITNYGVLIAYLNGILERSIEIFTGK